MLFKNYFVVLPLFIALNTFSQTPYDNPEDWELILEENFTNEEFDSEYDENYWYEKKDKVKSKWVYKEENVNVEDGYLKIDCVHEDFMGVENSTGRLQSKHGYKYGFFEIRCKMPADSGVWPAFWLTHNNNGWPPEIDVFEAYGQGTYGIDANRITGGTWFKDFDSKNKPDYSYKFENFSIDKWHNYAIEWNKGIIYWYIDNQLIAVSTEHVPDKARAVTIDMQTKNAPDNFNPETWLIDYVKIWKRKSGCNEDSWSEKWESSDPNTLGGWNINSDDKYIPFDFNNDGKDEMLFINSSTQYARVYEFNNGNWTYSYSNSGSGDIGGWNMNPEDIFVAGDYDNDNKDEILMVNNTTKFARVYEFNNGNWTYSYSNSGSGEIGGWDLNSEDIFIAGDYDNDNKDEILMVNNTTKFARVYKFNNGNWTYSYSNSGSGEIGGWNLNPEDIFISGDYNKDNKDEILIVNNTTKFARIYNYNNGSWTYKYSNSGNGDIGGWNMNPEDIMVPGDFNNDGKDEILFINNNHNYSRVYEPSNSKTWNYHYSNHGNLFIYNWHFFPDLNDQLIVGKFESQTPSQLFVVRNAGVDCYAYTDHEDIIKARLYEYKNCIDNKIPAPSPEKRVLNIGSSERGKVNMNINIYPNPNNGKFNLISSESIGEILVFNHSGQLVKTEFTMENQKVIDLSEYSMGVYYLNVTSNTSSQVLKIIIK